MYAIVDIETTGGHASSHAITEIAIHIHDGEKVVHHFTSLINPSQHIPAYITALTGISNSMVASAPVFDEVAKEVFTLLQDKVFVAHSVNFDYSFVNQQLKNSGYRLQVNKLCTVRLSRKVFSGLHSYSLGSLCRAMDIPIEDRHRADGDAKATVLLFEKLLHNGAGKTIEEMLKKSSSEQWLPLHLEKKEISSLPALPGVYYFVDVKGKVIYVGKALNIRKRVASHFTKNDAHPNRQHFIRLVHRINHTVCANELQALVLESTEIKKLWPKFNRSQKSPAQKYGLYCYDDSRGYCRLAIDKKKKHLPALYHFNLLHEGRILLKKMTEEFGLNSKLCNLDKTDFTAKEWGCMELPGEYNSKVQTALQALEKNLPSFAIVDEGADPQYKLYLLIDRGCFWGMGSLHRSEKVNSINDLKEKLTAYADNDFIRNSIYGYASNHPEKKVVFEK